MADKIPVRARFIGTDVTALQEFEPTDTIALSIISGFAAGVTIELGNNSIAALADVNTPTPANNEVLTFNSGTGKWEAQVSPGNSAAIWGNITGTLSNQLDLQSVLDTKIETASNVGTGDGVFAQKVAQDLELKTLVAGESIQITPSATELLIDSRRDKFFAHNGGITQTFGSGRITVLFPTVARSDAAYTYNSGEVTINTAGWYFIEYQVSADNTGNSRSTSEIGVTINSLTTFQPGSFGYGYHRNSSDGKGSFTGRILVQLSVNDIIRIRIRRDGSGSTLETLPDACRLTIISTGAP